MTWNHRLVRDDEGLHVAEVFYDIGKEIGGPQDGYAIVTKSWRTWVDFIRRPAWLIKMLRSPVMDFRTPVTE